MLEVTGTETSRHALLDVLGCVDREQEGDVRESFGMVKPIGRVRSS